MEIAQQTAPDAGPDLVKSLAELEPFVGPEWSGRLAEAAEAAAVELGSLRMGWPALVPRLDL